MTQSLYFAACGGKIKIGCSVNVAKRIEQVGEWLPMPITLLATMPGSYALERTVQDMFDSDWSHGEWFHASDRLLQFVDDIANGRPVAIDTEAVEAAASARRSMIADKKRIARKRARLPASIVAELDAVPVGVAIPSDLLTRAYSALSHGRAA